MYTKSVGQVVVGSLFGAHRWVPVKQQQGEVVAPRQQKMLMFTAVVIYAVGFDAIVVVVAVVVVVVVHDVVAEHCDFCE